MGLFTFSCSAKASLTQPYRPLSDPLTTTLTGCWVTVGGCWLSVLDHKPPCDCFDCWCLQTSRHLQSKLQTSFLGQHRTPFCDHQHPSATTPNQSGTTVLCGCLPSKPVSAYDRWLSSSISSMLYLKIYHNLLCLRATSHSETLQCARLF